jgi:Zn-dependent peptidase ImmA (M78 family)
MNIRRKHISRLALSAVSRAGISKAPVDVVTIARQFNAIVKASPTDDKFAGYLFRHGPGGYAIIGVNSLHSPTRQRFTIAHEIGHLLLHADELPEEVHVDHVFMRRDSRSAAGTDHREIEANAFAADLLMPTQFIERDLQIVAPHQSSEEVLIAEMARLYEVSPQAMGIRLANLGYCNQ